MTPRTRNCHTQQCQLLKCYSSLQAELKLFKSFPLRSHATSLESRPIRKTLAPDSLPEGHWSSLLTYGRFEFFMLVSSKQLKPSSLWRASNRERVWRVWHCPLVRSYQSEDLNLSPYRRLSLIFCGMGKCYLGLMWKSSLQKFLRWELCGQANPIFSFFMEGFFRGT